MLYKGTPAVARSVGELSEDRIRAMLHSILPGGLRVPLPDFSAESITTAKKPRARKTT